MNGQQLFLNDGPASDTAALAELQRMLTGLAAMKPTVLLLNIPSGETVDPRRMIVRDPWRGTLALRTPVLTRESYLAEYGDLRDKLRAVAVKAGVPVIDPLDVICPAAVCPSVAADGRPLYKDASHLRPFYVREHASFIDQTLRRQ